MTIYIIVLFSSGIARVVSVTEMLKLFSPICPLLSHFNVNCLHVFHLIVHFTTGIPLFFLNTGFQSSTEATLIAQWFRYGSAINIFYVCCIAVAELSMMHFLMVRFIRNSPRSTKQYQERHKDCIRLFIILNVIYSFVVVLFALAVIIDGPAGSNANKLYQTLASIMFSTSLIAAILSPIVFDKIVALKFQMTEVKNPKQLDEPKTTKLMSTTVEWTQKPQ
jgi:hypothetical protein